MTKVYRDLSGRILTDAEAAKMLRAEHSRKQRAKARYEARREAGKAAFASSMLFQQGKVKA